MNRRQWRRFLTITNFVKMMSLCSFSFISWPGCWPRFACKVNWYRNSTRDISWTYTNSFIEGVVVAKKDFDAPKHDEIDTKNLFVIKALQSLTSKGYVKTQFSWQYYYYTLTDEGVEFLRNELNIPEGILPLTRLKGAPAERPQRASRGPRRDGDSYRRRARD